MEMKESITAQSRKYALQWIMQAYQQKKPEFVDTATIPYISNNQWQWKNYDNIQFFLCIHRYNRPDKKKNTEEGMNCSGIHWEQWDSNTYNGER